MASDSPTSQQRALTDLGRSLFMRRFTHGRTGNLSVRIGDELLITPTGVSLGDLQEQELSRITLSGEHVSGPKPSKEWFLHAALYRARPAERAVVHLHSVYSVACSCLEDADAANAIPALTPYYVMRVGSVPLLPYFAPGDPAVAPVAEAAAKANHALLISNHGPIVAGRTLAQAAEAIEELEETARLYLLLKDHRIRQLTPAAIRDLEKRFGPAAGGGPEEQR